MRERRKLNRVDVANRTYRPPRSRPRGRPVAFSAAVAGTAESARFHLLCVGSRFRPRWSSPGWSGAGVGSVRRVLHDRAATEPGPTRFCVRGDPAVVSGAGSPRHRNHRTGGLRSNSRGDLAHGHVPSSMPYRPGYGAATSRRVLPRLLRSGACIGVRRCWMSDTAKDSPGAEIQRLRGCPESCPRQDSNLRPAG